MKNRDIYIGKTHPASIIYKMYVTENPDSFKN